jgi:hypothetical protein
MCAKNEDWYSIPLSADDELDISLNHVAANGDLDIYLYKGYKSPGTLIAGSFATNQDVEEILDVVIAPGDEGLYLIQVVSFGASFTRNTYDLDVTVTGLACETCASLGVTCGTWDSGCGYPLDCDSECPGLGTTHYCELSVPDGKGTCAQYFDDLAYGCCEADGVTVHNAKVPGKTADCSSYGSYECGWVISSYYTGQTGYFTCVALGTGTTPHDYVFAECPSGMTWAP